MSTELDRVEEISVVLMTTVGEDQCSEIQYSGLWDVREDAN